MLADCEQPTDDDTYNAWEHALAYFKQSMPSEVAEVVTSLDRDRAREEMTMK